jgi:hypothetical protein
MFKNPIQAFATLFFLMLSTLAFAKLEMKYGYEVIENKDGTYTLRIHFNYQNLSKKIIRLKGTHQKFSLYFPLPKRFIPLEAKLNLMFYSSPALIGDRSVLNVALNGKDLFSTKLNPTGKWRKLSIKVPVKGFEPHNFLTVEVFQHYTLRYCEPENSSELWTDLDLANSYIDIKFTYKLVPDTLRALQTYIHDPLNIYRKNINIVVDLNNLNSNYLKSLALLTGMLAEVYKYADMNINILPQPSPNGDNYIIGNRDFISKVTGHILADYNIYIEPNAFNPFFKNIILTGESFKEINRAILALFLGKVNLLDVQGLKIESLEDIPPLPAYQAPNFWPLGQKIYFRDLGIKTVTLGDGFKKFLKIPYKIYPDTLFGDKDKVKVYLDLQLPKAVGEDSVINVFAESLGNKVFLFQIPVKRQNADSKEYYFYANILPKGEGQFSIEPILVPLRSGFCQPSNRKSLLVTVGEDSYIELPKGVHITEMPYLEFFASTAYPYSIYADLQDTALIITKKRRDLIASALKVVYFMAQRIQYPPIYLTVNFADNVSKQIFNKNLIVVGPYNPSLRKIFGAGAIAIPDERTIKYRIPLIGVNDEENNQIKKFVKLSVKGVYTPVMVEMFESPFKSGKTVMLIYSPDEKTLRSFVNYVFSLQGAYWLRGDTVLYAPEGDEIYTYNLNDKYIVGKASPITKIKYNLAIHPEKYLIAIIVGAASLAVVILILLNLFKRKMHRDAE